MKKNNIEELKQMLEELYRTQQARLDVGADDLDIREEIAEVEEEIKELQDETLEENSIEEDIERLKLCSTNQCNICGRYEKEECMLERNRCEQHILSAYKRILKENEELKQEKQDYFEKYQYNLKQNESLTREFSNCIPVQKVKDKIEELNKQEKIELKGLKGQDRYFVKQMYQNKRIVLQELLEKEK